MRGSSAWQNAHSLRLLVLLIRFARMECRIEFNIWNKRIECGSCMNSFWRGRLIIQFTPGVRLGFPMRHSWQQLPRWSQYEIAYTVSSRYYIRFALRKRDNGEWSNSFRQISPYQSDRYDCAWRVVLKFPRTVKYKKSLIKLSRVLNEPWHVNTVCLWRYRRVNRPVRGGQSVFDLDKLTYPFQVIVLTTTFLIFKHLPKFLRNISSS